MATVSLGVLGVMGAMLSITGIFGMASYSVSRRLRELGIRIAIGAQPREVLQAALGRAIKLLAIGSAAGLALGILAARVLASLVYQATPRDPLVLAGVVLAMMFLGLLATWIPAQRALSLDQGTLDHEREIIAEYGNMSAPTVLFVLERARAAGLPPRSLLTALGPGFTASCVALRHAA